MLVQIVKALYGLVQSAALWFDALSIFLKSLGFKPNPLDECVLKLETKTRVLIIILYVDDVLLLADKEIMITWLLNELELEYKTIVSDTSDSFTYLGMVVTKHKDMSITIHMGGYIENMLAKWEAHSKVKAVVTPATKKLFDVDEDQLALSMDMAKKFHTTTAKLLYLCKRARPDV